MSWSNEYTCISKHMSDIPLLSSASEHVRRRFWKILRNTTCEKVARESFIPTDGKVLAIYHDEEFDRHMSDIELASGRLRRNSGNPHPSAGDVAVTIH